MCGYSTPVMRKFKKDPAVIPEQAGGRSTTDDTGLVSGTQCAWLSRKYLLGPSSSLPGYRAEIMEWEGLWADGSRTPPLRSRKRSSSRPAENARTSRAICRSRPGIGMQITEMALWDNPESWPCRRKSRLNLQFPPNHC